MPDVPSLTLRLTGRDARATEPRIGRPTTFVAVRKQQEGTFRLPWLVIEVYLRTWETKENGVIQGEGDVVLISDVELKKRYKYALIQTGPRPRGREHAGRIALYARNPQDLSSDD